MGTESGQVGTVEVDPIARAADAAGVAALGAEALAHAGACLARLRALDPATATADELLGPLDELHAALAIAGGAPQLLGEVHPEAGVRDAARAIEPDLDRFATELYLDPTLARVVRAVAERCPPTDGPRARLLEHTLRDLRRNGLELPAADQGRLRALNDDLTRVGQAFSKNLAEASASLVVPVSALGGLPPEWVAEKRAASADGLTVTVTTDYPDYLPFMRYADDRPRALELYRKFDDRAAEANVPLLEEMLLLRENKAHLLGYPSWAAYAIEPRMAKTPEAVRAFLASVADAVRAPAARELAALEAEHVALGGRAGDKLPPCDRIYLEERVRASRFSLDSQALAQHFEVRAVQAGLLALTGRLFGIAWRRADVDAWHPDVEVWDAHEDGRTLGRLYLDLYPRPSKYKHAAVFGVRPSFRRVDGSRAVPTAALVANFPRPGGAAPALLSHDDVVTFLHELGHVLHQLLTASPLAAFSGTATARDFVEVPSQMLEEWAFRREALDGFARHHETGAAIPDALFGALVGSRGFGRALATQRQLFLATLDLEYHTRPAGFDTSAVLREIFEAQLPFAFVEGTHFQATFGHLVGYDAGYYGYQWALSIARDVLGPFERAGFLDAGVAAAYRRDVLAPGGSEDEASLVARFLGRPADERAYAAFLRGA